MDGTKKKNKNVPKVVGATSSEGFLVITNFNILVASSSFQE